MSGLAHRAQKDPAGQQQKAKHYFLDLRLWFLWIKGVSVLQASGLGTLESFMVHGLGLWLPMDMAMS